MAKCDQHQDVDLVTQWQTAYTYTCTNCGYEVSSGGSTDKGPTITVYCYHCSKDFTDRKQAKRSAKRILVTYCPKCNEELALRNG